MMKKALISYAILLFPIVSFATDFHQLVNDARKQINITVGYDPAYHKIDFPMGDVPIHTGVCTDVVIRAYRQQKVDLQKLVHQDMKKAWANYPKIWGLKATDTNIDHRRVPNLEIFFKRHARSLSLTDLSSFKAGDIVTWRLPRNLPHIGIVSDKKSKEGIPLIIHNIGQGTQEEDILFKYKIIAHYRY
ncbi:protein YijF [Pasteurella canis]|nr:protein YijF [Pasteurella canis]